MFRHGKSKVIIITGIAALLSLIAAAVMGVSPLPVSVKLTPAMVSVDTSALPPGAAQAEMAAVWRLFDRDTETAYMPSQMSRITVSLPELKTVSRIRVYGASSYTLTVYRDNAGSWEPVPSLSGLNLTSLGASWNSVAPSESFSATHLLFEFIPQGNVTAGIREIELWGPEASTGQESAAHVTLEGIATPQEALAILGTAPSHILEFTASPSELSVSDAAISSVSIPLTQDPVLFKRAYILYDGYNLVRSVSIARSINNLSWSGGLVIPQPEGTAPSWSSYIEEINPAWLVQGENKIDFKSASGNAAIRGLRLIVEIDSGWNTVSAVSASALYDGDTGTSYEIRASSAAQNIQIDFERTVQPETIRLHVPGVSNLKATVQYRNGTLWQDVKAGWQIDFAALQTGWNEITIPAAVKTQALRLVFTTSSLRIRPGGIAGSVNELRVSASPAGAVSQTPRIVISYPRDGEYFGRTAYIQGFATPASTPAGTAQENIEGKIFSSTDGAFSLSLTKDETRFSSQPDDEAWDPLVKSEYGTQAGALLSLILNKNSGNTAPLTSDKESRGDAPFGDNREKFSDKVAPGQAKKIQFKGVTLDIPAGAVDKETEITIIPLTEADLARLNPGMINVTYPDAGYRFLPHGMKFLKPIKISFGYAKQLFAAGQVDEDVNMYYYDEKFLRWTVLKKLKVDPAQSLVESESDHFTDIINSTLVVPEHPQALSFNPNSIKDIKAADPSANVNLIEPPRANNKGTANLSYPIEVPPGRNKLQPNLAVQYNSSGGNGWLGLGWDIPMQAITIDTRWGVPRYDSTYDDTPTSNMETETYLLDGEQLTPLAHRGALQPRTSEKIFHARVEGQFRRIIRHGSQPNNYWWEVIDKNGTKYFYGGDPAAKGVHSGSVLTDYSGNIFKWALREIRDTNGNFVKFHCAKVEDSGVGAGTTGVPGYQLYLKTITYTGNGTTEGSYAVTFVRDRELGEPRRPDVMIDARGGFKAVTADLLRKIVVTFGGTITDGVVFGGTSVRQYEFSYAEGAFHKTLLKSVSQYGSKGTLFNTHTFGYYDDITSGASYNGFSSSTQWDTQDDDLGIDFLGVSAGPSALSGSEGISGGGSFSIGFAPFPTKYLSFNGMIGTGMSNSRGTLQLADIDGDGLPDKVYRSGGAIKFHRNTVTPKSLPTAPISFDGTARTAENMGLLSEDESMNFNGGGQAYIFGLNLILDLGTNFTTQRSYVSDVNGDGLLDVVKSGQVWFNRWKNRAAGDFTPLFSATSAGTESPIGAGSVDPTGMLPEDTFKSIEEKLLEENPLMDVVRQWKAPYSGTISIDGNVQLINVLEDPNATEEEKKKRQDYTTADGVRVAIERPGLAEPLWRKDIPATDFTNYPPENASSLDVQKGDVLYFRVQSNFDGAYDDVSWSPRVRYSATSAGGSAPEGATDVNKLDPYVFKADQEFVYAGRVNPVELPFKGTVRITGTLEKIAKTTDDVRISIYQYTDAEIQSVFKYRRDYLLMHTKRKPVARYSMRAEETGTMSLDQTPGLVVQPKDRLFIIVEIDSNIDLTRLQWKTSDPLKVFYTEAYRTTDQPTDENGDPVRDEDGNPAGWVPGSPIQVQDSSGNYIIQMATQQEMNFYPDNDLQQAQSDFAAAETGWLMVNPQVTPKPVAFDDGSGNIIWKYPFRHTTEVAFTAKQRGELGGKRVLTLSEGTEYEPRQQSFAVPVYKGDRLFFDFSTRDPELYPTLESTGASAHYIRPKYTVTLNDVPVNKANKVAEWQAAAGTKTVLPILSALPGSPALSGEIVLHVSHVYANDQGSTVTAPVVDRRIDFDTQTTFNPYAHAFDLPDVSYGTFVFSYSVADDDLAAALDAHGVLIAVQTGFNATQQEFSGLELFVVPPAVPDTDTGKALLPVGSNSARVAIAPVIKQNGALVSEVNGSATLTVIRRYTVTDASGNPQTHEEAIAHVPVSLTAGKRFNPGEHTFDVDVQANDTLVMYFSTEDSAVASVDLDWGLWTQTRRHTNGGAPVSTPPSMLHRYGYWDLFANSYRGWAYAGYNSEGLVNGVLLKDQPIISSRLTVPSNESDYEVPDDPAEATSMRVKDMTAFPAVAQPEHSRWYAGDENWRVKADRMRSSRMGLDYVHLPRASELQSSVPSEPGGSGATAPPRMSIVELETTMGIGFIVNINHTETPGQGLLDFMDMNGDRFPDVVGGNTIQYSNMVGGLGSKTGGTGTPYVRDSMSTADNIAPGGTVQQAIANAKGLFNPKDGNANQTNKNSSFGLTGSLGKRENDVKAEYMDVNGDGLPDRVYDSGGAISVAINLGYGFAAPEPWGAAVVDDSETKYVNAGVSTSYNDGVKGYSGSLSLTQSLGKTNRKLIDINGDGLLDRVSQGSGGLVVGINRGNGFATERTWTGSASLGNNQSFSLNGGVALNFTIGPLCIALCYIDLNPGISISTNTARAESTIQDVNGDGYPDSLASTEEDKLTVALNRTGRTNLLKNVKRPLGGKFEVEYEREGNTYDMPQSQWVMTRATLSDGMGNTYSTDYAYAGGYQDRYEREFYGFRTVTETQAPGKAISRQTIQTFYNNDFYRKGQVQSTVTRDMKANPGYVWSRTENDHRLHAVKDDNNQVLADTVFPALVQTTTSFYDGSTTNEDNRNKYTYQTFAYDKYGNVTTFDDEGEVFTDADDVTATITYHIDLGNYIIKPGTILVTHGSTQLRKRTATYSSTTGNLETLTLHNTRGPNAFWRMTYDTVYGNLETITDPVGYELTYTYDDEVATYVTRIEDNFTPSAGGRYYSRADYNPLFGQPDWTQDLSLNYQVNLYDEFGRMAAVCSPYDVPDNAVTCAGVAAGTIGDAPVAAKPTIAFVYTMPILQGEDNQIGGTPLQPARAVTYNKAVSVKGSDPIIVKTVTFVDGMKRIIQTKKDADVNGAYGMTVSGKIVFDDLGRTIAQGQPKFEAASFDFINYSAPRNPTLFSYDTLDRTTEVLTPDAKGSVTIGPNRYAKTTTIYAFGDVNGDPYAKTVVIDPEGNKVNGAGFRGTKISYKDVDDRIVAVLEYNRIKDPETKQETLSEIRTSYDYDPLGQITKVVDNKGNTTTVSYDDLGRRLTIDNRDTGLTRYTYDANGNLVTKSTANNHKISYKYDFNRLMAIDYPNNLKTAPVSYEYGAMGEAYNRAGRIRKVIDESGEEVRYYGKLGEVTREEKTVEAKTPAVQRKKFSTDYVSDSFGRMQEMTYPDGEKLHYAYDNGGLLKAAWGEKSGNRYDYITTLLYNEFGQRISIVYGNGTKSTYAYDELTRRLDHLTTVLKDGRTIQNIAYDYDLVGNVGEAWNNIAVPTSTALPAGPIKQKYEYDDLYQISDAKGWYSFGPGKENNYQGEFFYDTIGNFTRKNQAHKIIQPSTTETLPKETNYVLKYVYGSDKPHAVTDAGDKLYTYDKNGNMTGWTHKQNGTRRTIYWNEDNRVKQIDDNGKSTYFLYDDAGERVVKRGQHGETIYVNRFFTIRNGELGTKSVYAGEARVVSKLVKTPPTNTANSTTTTTTTTSTSTTSIPGEQGLDHGRGKKLGIIKRLPDGYQAGINPPVEKDQFYYHGDHLGSSNMITDAYGAVYQHLEYFPYGETWIEEGGSYGGNTPAYKFTGKELDPETGLYYYGARYYDPVLSRWISADPIFEKYLPTGNNKLDRELPGMGGVHNSLNLGLYSYTHQNPLKFVDPDGNDVKGVIQDAIDWLIGENSGAVWKEAVTVTWVKGPSGGKVPPSIRVAMIEVFHKTPKNAFENGYHAWHAGSNAMLSKKLGFVGAPVIFWAGVYHETPLDSDSFWEEQENQGTVNHILDSVTDIFANVFGMTIGYIVPGAEDVDLAINAGNYIPGPADSWTQNGKPKQRGYTGDPTDAWGTGQGYPPPED